MDIVVYNKKRAGSFWVATSVHSHVAERGKQYYYYYC